MIFQEGFIGRLHPMCLTSFPKFWLSVFFLLIRTPPKFFSYLLSFEFSPVFEKEDMIKSGTTRYFLYFIDKMELWHGENNKSNNNGIESGNFKL